MIFLQYFPANVIFFRKALDFVKQHGFDGIDLDYEFPDASDKVNFAEWVKDIKTVFQPEGYEVKMNRKISIPNMHLVINLG